MSYMELDDLKKLRQFDTRDTGCCSAFCPFHQSNYCRLYKVELVATTRCTKCDDYSKGN